MMAFYAFHFWWTSSAFVRSPTVLVRSLMFTDCAYFLLQQKNELEYNIQISNLEGDELDGAGMGVASVFHPKIWRPNIHGSQ